MTTTNLEQQAPVEERSVSTSDGANVSATVTNDLNSDTSFQRPCCRDQSLTQSGDVFAFSSADSDPLADIKSDLGLSSTYSGFRNMLDRAQVNYGASGPYGRGFSSSSGDDSINYWNGERTAGVGNFDAQWSGANNQPFIPRTIESNGQRFQIDINSSDPCCGDLARSLTVRDYMANNMGFDRATIDMVAGQQTAMLMQRYPDRADLIQKANQEWTQRYEGGDRTNEVANKPRIDNEAFGKIFTNSIRNAYMQTGNHPSFWPQLQKNIDGELQKLIDQGTISPDDKKAFNEVFMKAAKDVYRTDAYGPPSKFWEKLQDRILTDMDTWRRQNPGDLPVPPKPDDSTPDNPNPQPNPGDGSVKQARDRLHQSLEGQLSPERIARMDKMMAEFEQRGSERVEALVTAGKDRATVEKEWQEKIKETYNHLSDMVTSNNPSAPYDKSQRAKLAENAMYLIMDPTKTNQGQHGTCWIEAGINKIGLTSHPEDMARMLKEVATTGTYKDLEGKTYKIPSQLLQFPGEEKNWTISNADNGLRSPVGAIFDRTLSYMGGRMDGGTNGGYPQEMAGLMKKVTGDTITMVQIRDNNLTQSDIERLTSSQYRQQMLEDGGVVVIGPGHMFGVSLVKNNGQWNIVGDNQWGANNDQLIGRVTDLNSWSVQRTRERYTPDIQSSLRVSGDTPIGVKSMAQQPQSYGYYYYGYRYDTDYNSQADTPQQAQTVTPRGGKSNVIYDDYNPNYRINVEGGGETRISDGERRDTQFRRRDWEQKREKMIRNWEQLRQRAGQPVTATGAYEN